MVEVHRNPSEAFSDGGQSLKPEDFVVMINQVRGVAEAIGRQVAPPSNNLPPPSNLHIKKAEVQ